MSETKQDKKRITLRDVAEEAGVSLKTASNVINNSGRMTENTREKVQGVIDRLGYRVNVAARNLNRGNTRRDCTTTPFTSPLMRKALPVALVHCSKASTPLCRMA